MGKFYRGLAFCVNAGLSIFVECHDVVSVCGPAFNFHTRTADGHAWYSNAGNVWFLAEHLLYDISGYVPFYDVAINNSRMAGSHFLWDTKLCFDVAQVRQVGCFYRKASFFKVCYPFFAASTGRCLINDHVWQRLAVAGCAGGDQEQAHQAEERVAKEFHVDEKGWFAALYYRNTT